MIKTTYTAQFGSSVDKVWHVVTNHDECAWRSDIIRTEVSTDKNTFTEYTKDEFATTFTVTLKIPHERYEFAMENANLTGHWTGIFTKNNGRTIFELVEEVNVLKVWMRPLAKMYLKMQQKKYVADLRKALGE